MSAKCHKQTFTQGVSTHLAAIVLSRFQGKVCCPVAIAHQESTIVLSVRCSRHLQRVGDQSRSLRQDYRAKEQRRRSPQANRHGSFRKNFGVLGQTGGRRRLNVAMTRRHPVSGGGADNVQSKSERGGLRPQTAKQRGRQFPLGS